MNELTTELKSLHEDTLKNLKNSKANNTLRAYKSDFKDFGVFCSNHGLKSLPTEPKIIALYLTHLSKYSKISTLRRRLVSISMIHKIKGYYLDTKHPIIIENLLGIKRLKGSRQLAKKPLLIEIHICEPKRNPSAAKFTLRALARLGNEITSVDIPMKK